MSCWKDWLHRQSTCPHCRKHTEMNTLSKLVYDNDEICGEEFTQMCESDDDDELEIMAK
jgi:hypothetical protein